MKFEKSYIVGAREMGIKNEINNYGILSFFEDVAITHSDNVGYGIKDVYTKKRAWLLMDWNLKVYKRPSFGEKIYTKTWAFDLKKPTYSVYRNFEAFDDNNDLIATACSKWVFYDLSNDKLTKIDNDIISIYNPEEYSEEEEDTIKKLKQPSLFENIFQYKVKRSDIDVNQHMHNLNYLNLAYEALPNDIYNNLEFNNVRIMYKHQIKFGSLIKCFYHFENGIYTITIKSEDEKILHAIVELEP